MKSMFNKININLDTAGETNKININLDMAGETSNLEARVAETTKHTLEKKEFKK